MKNKLKAIQPTQALPSKPKILIFGKPGVGKTWVSLDFPAVYYIDTEGGANLGHYTEKLTKGGGAYMGPQQDSLSLRSIIEQVQLLATQEHPYRTLVIDSISKVFAIRISEEAERLDSINKKNEYGADRKPAVAEMKKLVSWLSRLDMTVILVAHEKPLWKKQGEERVEIGSTFDCWEKLEYELHLCLNIIRQGVSAPQALVRKSRLADFPFGQQFPWSFQEFVERYGKDAIDQSRKRIELGAEEEVQEAKHLVELVQLPHETLAKWFNAAGVEGFEEMERPHLLKCIAALKAKIPSNPN